MDIVELATKLARATTQPLLAGDGDDYRYVDASPANFVAPQVSSRTDLGLDAPALLITAPAAAGKTTCAEALASHTGGLIMNLSRKRLGDGSFTGLIEDALGEEGGPAFRSALKANEVVLILDALDESNVASGDNSFVSFVRGMCRFLRTSNGTSNLILLSRAETAVWIRSTFEEENVELAEYEIDYFDGDSSRAYIDLKLDAAYARSNSSPVHQVHRGPFLQARDKTLTQLAGLLGYSSVASAYESAEGRRFMGYSPVLEGIASYLCVDDFRTLSLDTNGQSTTDFGEWDFLVDLLTDLLLREQSKLLDAWLDDVSRPMFGSVAQLETIFNPTEQSVRLSHAARMQSTSPSSMAKIPEPLQQSYDDAVLTQIGNHPFLQNSREFVSPIFRDFALASALTSDLASTTRQQILSSIRRNQGQAYPALGPFLLILTARGNEKFQADLTDVVMLSLGSRRDQNREFSFQISIKDGNGYFLVADGQTSSAFDLRAETSIKLPRALRNVDVVTDQDISIEGTSLQIGPNVSLAATLIDLSARECVVNAHQTVSLTADWVNANWDQEVTIRGGEFSVSADECEGWPERYRSNRSDDRAQDVTDERALALRRIIKFFRRTQHTPEGYLAADKEQLQLYVLRTDQTARDVVAIMGSRGYVSESGKELYFQSQFFSDAQMNYEDLISLRLTAQLRELLQ